MRISDIIDGRTSAPKKRKARILTILIIVTGLMSLLFVFVTIYGQYTGSFTMKLVDPETKRGIALSETVEGFNSGGVTRLSFLPLKEAIESDFDSLAPLHEKEILTNNGQYFNGGNDFSAYTFYLKNVGELRTSVRYTIRFKESVNNMHSVVRIRVYQTDVNNHYIYDDASNKNYQDFYMDKTLDPKDPASRLIANILIEDINPEEIRKFSIVYWVHGPDNTLREGAVKLEMLFALDGED